MHCVLYHHDFHEMTRHLNSEIGPSVLEVVYHVVTMHDGVVEIHFVLVHDGDCEQQDYMKRWKGRLKGYPSMVLGYHSRSQEQLGLVYASVGLVLQRTGAGWFGRSSVADLDCHRHHFHQTPH